jgi:1,4-dihydroxy-2-naphthoate octaprenyltransferase
VPVGALATNILVVNNVRDRQTDRAAGKGTLVARFGRSFGVAEYVVLLLAAFAVPVLLLVQGRGNPFLLLPLAMIPRAALYTLQLVRLEGRPLNAVLVGTARLMVLYGVLFTLALVYGTGPLAF